VRLACAQLVERLAPLVAKEGSWDAAVRSTISDPDLFTPSAVRASAIFSRRADRPFLFSPSAGRLCGFVKTERTGASVSGVAGCQYWNKGPIYGCQIGTKCPILYAK
jgi:hypothetical protein